VEEETREISAACSIRFRGVPEAALLLGVAEIPVAALVQGDVGFAVAGCGGGFAVAGEGVGELEEVD